MGYERLSVLFLIFFMAVVLALLHKKECKWQKEAFSTGTTTLQEARDYGQHLEANDMVIKDNQRLLDSKLKETSEALKARIQDKDVTVTNTLAKLGRPDNSAVELAKMEVGAKVQGAQNFLDQYSFRADGRRADIRGHITILDDNAQRVQQYQVASKNMLEAGKTMFESQFAVLDEATRQIDKAKSSYADFLTAQKEKLAGIDKSLGETDIIMKQLVYATDTLGSDVKANTVAMTNYQKTVGNLQVDFDLAVRETEDLKKKHVGMTEAQTGHTKDLDALTTGTKALTNTFDELKSGLEVAKARPKFDRNWGEVIKATGQGTIGIGLDNPTAKLDVNGDAIIGDPTMSNWLTINGPQEGRYRWSTGNAALALGQSAREDSAIFNTSMSINQVGVAVGPAPATAALDVQGTLRIAEPTAQRMNLESADLGTGVYLGKGYTEQTGVEFRGRDGVRMVMGGSNLAVDIKGGYAHVGTGFKSGYPSGVNMMYGYVNEEATANDKARMLQNGTIIGSNMVLTAATAEQPNWISSRAGPDMTTALGADTKMKGFVATGKAPFSVIMGETPVLNLNTTTGNIGVRTVAPRAPLDVNGPVWSDGHHDMTGAVRFTGSNSWDWQVGDGTDTSMYFVPQRNLDNAIMYGTDGTLSAVNLTSRSTLRLRDGATLKSVGNINTSGSEWLWVSNREGVVVNNGSGDMQQRAVNVDGNADVQGNLQSQWGLLEGATTMANNLTNNANAQNTAYFDGGMSVTGKLTAGGNICYDNKQCTPGTTFVQDVGFPMGAIVVWNSLTPPEGWALCNGAKATFRDGTTKATPNLQDLFIMGSGTRGINAKGGAASVTLNTNYLPAHNHGMSLSTAANHAHNNNSTGNDGQHTHTMDSGGSHSHGMDNAGNHNHNINMGNSGWVGNEGNYGSWSAVKATDRNYGSWNVAIQYSGSHSHNISGGSHTHSLRNSSHSHSHPFTTNTGGSHSHAATINATGGNTAIAIQPASITLVYIIKL